MKRILAVWPTPKMPDAQTAVWAEHLAPLTYDRCAAAVAKLERTSTRRPSLADLHDGYAAERTGRERTTAPVCGICEDGWIWVRCIGCDCGNAFSVNGDLCPKGHRTAARCPNGCHPSSTEEREQKLLRDNDAWQRDRQAVLRVSAGYDPSEPRREQQEEAF